jgi:hypothetical protein
MSLSFEVTISVTVQERHETVAARTLGTLSAPGFMPWRFIENQA